MKIQHYEDINASHAATGYHGRTDLPAFHIFTVEDTYPNTRTVMPPYTFNFYQVVLLENSPDATLTINAQPVSALSDSLTFASPQHVLAWVRGAQQRGYILYFKETFLAQVAYSISDDFPFFRLTENNYLTLSGDDKRSIHAQCARILALFHSDHPYRPQILSALLLALLFDCKRLYDTQAWAVGVSAQHALAARFQQFVNQHYLNRKTVKAYADLLHISPDHLSETIKAATGHSAHHWIVERVLLEAKKLLTYSDLTIAEIADYLGYAEPTHFGRVFRRGVGVSPREWRTAQLAGHAR